MTLCQCLKRKINGNVPFRQSVVLHSIFHPLHYWLPILTNQLDTSANSYKWPTLPLQSIIYKYLCNIVQSCLIISMTLFDKMANLLKP